MGKIKFKKLSKVNLPLKEQKRELICQVTDIHKSADGVFTKCFAKVDIVGRYRKEISAIVFQFQEKMNFACNHGIWMKKGA